MAFKLDDLKDNAEIAELSDEICKAIKRFLEYHFVDSAIAEVQEKFNQFAVYRVTVRRKTLKSVIRKIHADPALSTESPTANIPATQAFLKLTRKIKDLFGARIVVLSQRHKHAVRRSIDLLTLEGTENENHTVRILDVEPAPLHKPDSLERWKHFNPPPAHLYSSTLLNEEIEELLDAVTRASSVQDAASSAEQVRQILSDGRTRIIHKSSGYATLQKTLKMQHKDVVQGKTTEFLFEIQIRTLLEDAWLEPEHKMNYKGARDERSQFLLRNLGIQLQAADDVMQLIADRWREDLGHDKPRSSHTLRSFELKRSSKWPEWLKDDIEWLYKMQNLGRLSDVLRLIRRVKDKVEHSMPDGLMNRNEIESLLLDLDIEAAVSCLQLRHDDPRRLGQASRTYDTLLAGAKFPQLSERQKFWVLYRKSGAVIYQAESKGDAVGSRSMSDSARQAWQFLERASEIFDRNHKEIAELNEVEFLAVELAIWKAYVACRIGNTENLIKALEFAQQGRSFMQNLDSTALAHSEADVLWNRTVNGVAYYRYALSSLQPKLNPEGLDVAWNEFSGLKGSVKDVYRMLAATDVSSLQDHGFDLPEDLGNYDLRAIDTMLLIEWARAKSDPQSKDKRWARCIVFWEAVEKRLAAIGRKGETLFDSRFYRDTISQVKQRRVELLGKAQGKQSRKQRSQM